MVQIAETDRMIRNVVSVVTFMSQNKTCWVSNSTITNCTFKKNKVMPVLPLVLVFLQDKKCKCQCSCLYVRKWKMHSLTVASSITTVCMCYREVDTVLFDAQSMWYRMTDTLLFDAQSMYYRMIDTCNLKPSQCDTEWLTLAIWCPIISETIRQLTIQPWYNNPLWLTELKTPNNNKYHGESERD